MAVVFSWLQWIWMRWLRWIWTPKISHTRMGFQASRQITQRTHPKPAWVLREVLQLKALMPDAGCRQIADVFNRRFAPRESVSKSFVAYTVRAHRYEIEVLRRQLKHRAPAVQLRNRVWGLDMTGKADAYGIVHTALGIIDHGSRRLLCLHALQNKNAWTLLGHFFLAIGQFGRPRSARTDNEACFTSKAFTWGVALAGVRHQRTVPGCPWMNGRIERLFGTLPADHDTL